VGDEVQDGEDVDGLEADPSLFAGAGEGPVDGLVAGRAVGWPDEVLVCQGCDGDLRAACQRVVGPGDEHHGLGAEGGGAYGFWQLPWQRHERNVEPAGLDLGDQGHAGVADVADAHGRVLIAEAGEQGRLIEQSGCRDAADSQRAAEQPPDRQHRFAGGGGGRQGAPGLLEQDPAGLGQFHFAGGAHEKAGIQFLFQRTDRC
jgi:hypothetical protein